MYRAPLPAQLSDSNRRIIDTDATTLRAYQVWKGSNRFWLGGRLIFGPDIRSIFLTISLILIPVILFCAFVSQSLIHEFDHYVGNLVVAILILFILYDLILLLLTSGRDPGIYSSKCASPELEEDGSTMSTDRARNQGGVGVPSLPPTKDVVVNGVIVKVKYCRTCMLCRPPRCSRCSICNNCVERFDHHCPWVGQCIGKTTYEQFRYSYDSKMNPYNCGCVRNIFEIFFSKIPKSKNNFRSMVKLDSSALFATSMPLGLTKSPEMPKSSFDIEVGKRQAVAAEDLKEIHSQIDSVGGLERCRTQPRHTDHDDKANWGISLDIHMLAAEFGMEHGFKDTEKVRIGL